MADKGWTARVATAAGVAAGTGAAQLGLGYGLGVIVWPVTVAQGRSEWLGSLGWATWITASATVFGAVIASRLGGAPAARSRWPWRLALAISAGVGALVAVALIALPARAAVRLDAHPPQTIAAGYALLGVVLGVLVAYWAVVSRPVAANLIATAAWLWALAVAAIIVELSSDRDSATYLTSWQFVEADTGVRYGVIYWPSAVLTLVAAFVIGVVAVIPAIRRADLGLGAAISGAVGPLLVAISFLALSSRLTDTPGPIESAYLIAPYAVLAGLAGSALTVAAGQALAARQSTAGTASPAATATSRSKSDEAGEGVDTATRDEREAERTTSRPKVPTQPRQPAEPTPAGRASGPTPRPTSSSAPASPSDLDAPTTPPGPGSPTSSSGRDTPTPPPGPGSPTSSSGRSTATPPPGPGSPASSPGRSTATPPPAPGGPASSSGPGTATPPSAAGTPSLRPIPDPPRAPKPLTDPPKAPAPVTGRPAGPSSSGDDRTPPESVGDAEIAAAARTGRFRGRKAAAARKTPEAKPTKSTVTPPPAAPTIAQINPKPPDDDR